MNLCLFAIASTCVEVLPWCGQQVDVDFMILGDIEIHVQIGIYFVQLCEQMPFRPHVRLLNQGRTKVQARSFFPCWEQAQMAALALTW